MGFFLKFVWLAGQLADCKGLRVQLVTNNGTSFLMVKAGFCR
jgi:hypothetical protein